jgi:tol-pal system protein YbgF
LKTTLIRKAIVLAATIGLASGCYSTKMMEFTYQELDTLKTTQRELLEKLNELSYQVEEERAERLRTQAANAMTLQELREAIEILSYRIDDTAQRVDYPSTRPPVVISRDSLRARPDTLGAGGFDDSLRSSPRDSSVTPPPLPGGDNTEAENLFKGSYMDLTLGNYDLAMQGFKNYLVRYPGAANIPNAHYYLGESYYSMQRFLEAVAEYQNVTREYPRSRFAPAAYLKSGFCYQQLEERQLAERAFRELISLFPRSEEAEQARAALDDLGG